MSIAELAVDDEDITESPRFIAAVFAMAAICTDSIQSEDWIARAAVRQADALLAELAK